MNLAAFTTALLEQGKVAVDYVLKPFEEADRQAAVLRLKKAHEKAAQDMPGTWPDFSAEAALWSAEYLYRCVQLVLLRDAPAEQVEKLVQPWQGVRSAEVIASVDVMLRNLPEVLRFAKGLAPDDVLVKSMNEACSLWPLSSVGAEVQGALRTEEILRHPALRGAYRDRIIAAKDPRRLKEPVVLEMVEGALGDYAKVYWPELDLYKQKNITNGN